MCSNSTPMLTASFLLGDRLRHHPLVSGELEVLSYKALQVVLAFMFPHVLPNSHPCAWSSWIEPTNLAFPFWIEEIVIRAKLHSVRRFCIVPEASDQKS